MSAERKTGVQPERADNRQERVRQRARGYYQMHANEIRDARRQKYAAKMECPVCLLMVSSLNAAHAQSMRHRLLVARQERETARVASEAAAAAAAAESLDGARSHALRIAHDTAMLACTQAGELFKAQATVGNKRRSLAARRVLRRASSAWFDYRASLAVPQCTTSCLLCRKLGHVDRDKEYENGDYLHYPSTDEDCEREDEETLVARGWRHDKEPVLEYDPTFVLEISDTEDEDEGRGDDELCASNSGKTRGSELSDAETE
jgi:hypothetical protein